MGWVGTGKNTPSIPRHPLLGTFLCPSPQRRGCGRGGQAPLAAPRSGGLFPVQSGCRCPKLGAKMLLPLHSIPGRILPRAAAIPHPGMGLRALRGGTRTGSRGFFQGLREAARFRWVPFPGGAGGTNRRQRPGAKHAERPLISRSTVAPRGPGPQGSSGRAPTSCHRHRWRNRRGCAGRLERGGGRLRGAAMGAQSRAAGWS